MEAFIGTILPWALSWAPEGWQLCQGQKMTINQYQALYSLLGSFYGGDGSTYFNLPNLAGRVPLGYGSYGSTFYQIGATGGTPAVTLNTTQVPLAAHVHAITNTASVSGGGTGTATVEVKIPVNTDNQPSPMPTPPTYVNTPNSTCVLGQGKAGTFAANIYTTNAPTPNANLLPFNAQAGFNVTPPTVNVTSACAPTSAAATKTVPIMPPYQVINYIICVVGYYPPRP